MTIFYQLLAGFDGTAEDSATVLGYFKHAFYTDPVSERLQALHEWLKLYHTRRIRNGWSLEASAELMSRTNPRFILRNYLLHEANQDLEKGDATLFNRLHQALRYPYSTQADEFFVRRPDWAANQAGCSMLSCSS